MDSLFGGHNFAVGHLGFLFSPYGTPTSPHPLATSLAASSLSDFPAVATSFQLHPAHRLVYISILTQFSLQNVSSFYHHSFSF